MRSSANECIATDYDFCFTVIGGSTALIDRVVVSSELEGVEVKPNDLLLRYPKKSE